jgi:hypothetical protein
MSRTSHRLGAWIALATIGLHALWPLLAHAGPRADPALAEVCSVSGAKHAPEAAPGQGSQSHAAGAHCLSCPLSGERNVAVAGPCHAAWTVLAPVGVEPFPAIVALPARDLAVSARPRAPPARS